jgi:hypothetical protein
LLAAKIFGKVVSINNGGYSKLSFNNRVISKIKENTNLILKFHRQKNIFILSLTLMLEKMDDAQSFNSMTKQ